MYVIQDNKKYNEYLLSIIDKRNVSQPRYRITAPGLRNIFHIGIVKDSPL